MFLSKLQNFKISQRLIIGFGILTFFAALTSLVAITNTQTISRLINKLYDYPFTISTATLRIDGHIGHIQEEIKNILLAPTPEEIGEFEHNIANIEKLIEKDFKTLTDRLGSSNKAILAVQENLQLWREANLEIITLMKDGQSGFAWNMAEGDVVFLVNDLRNSIRSLIDNTEVQATEFLTDANSKTQSSFILLSSIASISLLISVLLTWFVTRSITMPLKEAVDISNRLSQGDLTIDREITDSPDEINQLLNSMSHMIVKLRDVIFDVVQTGEEINTISSSLDTASQELSMGTSNQAQSVESIVISMEEMNANVLSNNDNAAKTNEIANAASQNVEDSSNKIIEVIKSINNISNSIKIIGEIAEQTNLLAINAEIEAARAGSIGNGFSVVASEVRKLAQRSQEALVDISNVTKTIEQDATNSGDLLTVMVKDIQQTAVLVSQISTACHEQLDGIHQVNSAIRNLDSVVKVNATESEEMAVKSGMLSTSSRRLQKNVEFFKLD